MPSDVEAVIKAVIRQTRDRRLTWRLQEKPPPTYPRGEFDFKGPDELLFAELDNAVIEMDLDTGVRGGPGITVRILDIDAKEIESVSVHVAYDSSNLFDSLNEAFELAYEDATTERDLAREAHRSDTMAALLDELQEPPSRGT